MKKILPYFISLIIILIGIGLGFTIYQKTRKVDDEFIKQLYQNVNPSSDANILLPFYQTKKMNNEYMIDVGLMYYIRNQDKDYVEFISKEDVEKSIQKVLGNVTVNHEKVYTYAVNEKDNDKSYCGFEYNSSLERYEDLHGCDGNMNKGVIREIISTEQNKNEIRITEKAIFLYFHWQDENPTIDVYKDPYLKDKVDIVNGNSNQDVDIKKYDANTYTYVFKKIKGNYIFDHLE